MSSESQLPSPTASPLDNLQEAVRQANALRYHLTEAVDAANDGARMSREWAHAMIEKFGIYLEAVE